MKPLRDAAAEIVRLRGAGHDDEDVPGTSCPGCTRDYLCRNHAPALAEWATRAAAVLRSVAVVLEAEHYREDESDVRKLLAEWEGRRDG